MAGANNFSDKGKRRGSVIFPFKAEAAAVSGEQRNTESSFVPNRTGIARRGSKRVFDCRRRLTHSDAAVATGLMNTGARSDQRAEPTIGDQLIQQLARRGIDVEEHRRRNAFSANDLGCYRKVTPAWIGGGTDVALGDVHAFNVAHLYHVAWASLLGDQGVPVSKDQ